MKSLLRKAAILGVVVCSVLSTKAQDIHFSQFYLSPLNLNPAMTGVMNANTRVVLNYRNQWASILKSNAFNTYSLSYDQKVPSGKANYFGFGGTFWGDRAGEANFGTLTGKVSLAYAMKIGGDRRGGRSTYLSIGPEIGAAQRSIDFQKLKWGSQHDGEGGFDPNLPTGENSFDRDNFIFADLGLGGLVYSINKEGNIIYGGVAMHHLTRANQSFSSQGEDLLFSRYTAHVGGEFRGRGKGIGLVPGVIYMKQGPSFQVNAGTSMKFYMGSRQAPQAFSVGLWGRLANNNETGILTDAAILSTRFDTENFTLGLSYDVNVSSLRAGTNGNGGFELALQYRIKGKENRGIICPEF